MTTQIYEVDYDCDKAVQEEKEKLEVEIVNSFDEEKDMKDFEQCMLEIEKKEYEESDLIYENHMAKYEPEKSNKNCSMLDNKYNCPKWIKFLNEIFLGDQDMIAYIQKFTGSLMYDYNIEQHFYVLYGTGGNGKTTFLDIIKRVLEKYKWFELSSEILTKSNFKINQNIGYNLQYCKIAIIKEPEKRNKYHTSLIKALTGGGSFKVYDKQCGEQTYEPRARLIFETNYIPEFTDNDYTIERRIKIIPFKKTIFPYQNNKHLKYELLKELPEITKWVEEGMERWKKDPYFTEPLYMDSYKIALNKDNIDPKLAYAFSKLKRDYSAGLTINDFYHFASVLGCIPNTKDKDGKELDDLEKRKIITNYQTKIGKHLKELSFCEPVEKVGKSGEKVFLGLNFSKEELAKETDELVFDFSFKDKIKSLLLYDKENKGMIDFFTEKEYEYQEAMKRRKQTFIDNVTKNNNKMIENNSNDTVTNLLHSD